MDKQQLYGSASAAIINMHERGYVEDFQLTGTDLLWIQRKIVLEPGEFLIVESHCFSVAAGWGEAMIICGVILFCPSVKGILIKHDRESAYMNLPLDRVIANYGY